MASAFFTRRDHMVCGDPVEGGGLPVELLRLCADASEVAAPGSTRKKSGLRNLPTTVGMLTIIASSKAAPARFPASQRRSRSSRMDIKNSPSSVNPRIIVHIRYLVTQITALAAPAMNPFSNPLASE